MADLLNNKAGVDAEAATGLSTPSGSESGALGVPPYLWQESDGCRCVVPACGRGEREKSKMPQSVAVGREKEKQMPLSVAVGGEEEKEMPQRVAVGKNGLGPIQSLWLVIKGCKRLSLPSPAQQCSM